MSTVELVIVCVTVLLIVSILSGSRRSSDAPLLEGVEQGDLVVVYLRDGQTMRGRVRMLVPLRLEGAELVSEGKATSIGAVRVPDSSIQALQELNGSAPVGAARQ